MNEFDWIMVILSSLSVLLIPLVILTIRIAMKWTQLVGDVRQIAKDSHEDRVTMDKRLRWLEENLWRRK